MNKIQLMITEKSRDLGDENYSKLFDMSNNGIELYPKRDDFPMPWDAVCYIEEDMFIIDGDLGQQGTHRGYAKVGIPLNKVMNYLDLSIYAEDEYDDAVVAILEEHGWL